MSTETTTETRTSIFVEIRADHEEPFRFIFDRESRRYTDETAIEEARRFRERSGHRTVAIRKTTTVTTTVETVILYDSDASA